MAVTLSPSGLQYVEGGDPESDFPVIDESNMAILNASVFWQSGTFAAIPAASTVTPGTHYYATDVARLYINETGSAWQTVMIAGPWISLTVPSGFTTAGGGSPSPRYRLEGDKVVLSGGFQSTTGWSSSLALVGTPAPAYPAYLNGWCQTNNTFFQVEAIPTQTRVFVFGFTASAQIVYLDGLSYPLS